VCNACAVSRSNRFKVISMFRMLCNGRTLDFSCYRAPQTIADVIIRYNDRDFILVCNTRSVSKSNLFKVISMFCIFRKGGHVISVARGAAEQKRLHDSIPPPRSYVGAPLKFPCISYHSHAIGLYSLRHWFLLGFVFGGFFV
jgi:hypothetical protein